MKKVVTAITTLMLCLFLALVPVRAEETQETDPQMDQPVMVSASEKNATTIQVKWKTNGACKGMYVVYRKEGSGEFAPYGYVSATGAKSYTCTDTRARSKTKYTYTVAAIPSESIEDHYFAQSSTYSSGYCETKLTWEKSSSFKNVACYVVYIDGKIAGVYDSKVRRASFSYTYEDKEKDTPEYSMCVVSKQGWGTYDPVGVSAKTTIKTSNVTGTKLVATGKLRIEWKKSAGVTGYIVYRRSQGSSKWSKLATVEGESQLFCYDPKVSAKKTYYYTVKPFVKINGKTIYATWNKTGKKARYNSVTVAAKKGDYRNGSVYGPSLNQKQLSQVKKVVDNFCKSYITSDMTDVEKVMTAQLYMASNCTYAASWAQNGANTAWGALVYKNSKGYHEAQCSGYSRGFKALCDGMGVPCRYVHANSKSYNPSHQWNEVRIGKKWYIIDPQCNANYGVFSYFLCSGKTYTSQSGMKWDTSKYPKVASKDYSRDKIIKVYNGYKITRVCKKMFK